MLPDKSVLGGGEPANPGLRRSPKLTHLRSAELTPTENKIKNAKALVIIRASGAPVPRMEGAAASSSTPQACVQPGAANLQGLGEASDTLAQMPEVLGTNLHPQHLFNHRREIRQ